MIRSILFDSDLRLIQWCITAILTSCIFYHRKKVQNIFFAFFYGKFVAPHFVVGQLAPLKEELFACLKTMTSQDPKLKLSNSLRILEIGIGPGINLQYYPEGTRLTALDLNPYFEEIFASNRDKFSHLQVERFLIASAENMTEVEDNSFDVVVSTYVMCSVKNRDAIFKEIFRVLAPGGQYLFLEHVGFPQGSWKICVQKVLQPLWTVFGNGCRLTNDSSTFFQSAKFTILEKKIVYVPKLAFPVKPTLVGKAIKTLHGTSKHLA